MCMPYARNKRNDQQIILDVEFIKEFEKTSQYEGTCKFVKVTAGPRLKARSFETHQVKKGNLKCRHSFMCAALTVIEVFF